jgi:DNA-binding response OmpR family regulator
MKRMSMGKVLIIDDEHMTAEMLTAFLRIIGHESAEAYTCRHAWDKLTYFQPDAILLDIMLPDKNGLEMCRELRAHAATATTPIIMISAISPPMMREADDAGANGYLPKPISLNSLKTALANVGV